MERKKQAIIAFCCGLLLSLIAHLGITSKLPPVWGQSIRPEMAAEQVYQSLSFLPLENDYLSRRTGENASQNTLVLRLIRYHEYVKSRPLKHRFDWQLTFADYFDLNESIPTNRYPGHQTLTVNPLESDREVIINLTRTQRNQLIDTLLAIYNPQTETTPQQPATTPNNLSEERNNRPSLPQPGDADLLLPIK